MNIQLLIIDPQRDFCDPNGSLYVKGAEKDMDRVALMVKRLKGKLDDIHVTMDSHRLFDVAHPIYWVDSNGKNPAPFTFIDDADVESGRWSPSVPSLYKRSLDYTRQLKTNNRYQLCIWPVHCQIGSEGHGIIPNLLDALSDWERAPAMVDIVTKGSNPYTEHYSAVKAEVPDPEDPTTQLNTGLIKTLQDADIIAIAGEASSHCVANTVRDIADGFGDDAYVAKMHFLKDGSSYVAGLPNDFGKTMEEQFLREMTARGMKITTTTDFLS
jgi:nicotinamidase/pyrazinamidase